MYLNIYRNFTCITWIYCVKNGHVFILTVVVGGNDYTILPRTSLIHHQLAVSQFRQNSVACWPSANLAFFYEAYFKLITMSILRYACKIPRIYSKGMHIRLLKCIYISLNRTSLTSRKRFYFVLFYFRALSSFGRF